MIEELSDEEFKQLAVDEARGRLSDEAATAFRSEVTASLEACSRWRHALGSAHQDAQQQLVRLKEWEAEQLAQTQTASERHEVRREVKTSRARHVHHITKITDRLAVAKAEHARLHGETDRAEKAMALDLLVAYHDHFGPLPDLTDAERDFIAEVR